MAARCSPPAFPGLGIGFLGVALAFELTVLTMAFAPGALVYGAVASPRAAPAAARR